MKDISDLTIEYTGQLINMPLYKITKDEIKHLSEEIIILRTQINKLKSQTATQLLKQNVQKLVSRFKIEKSG